MKMGKVVIQTVVTLTVAFTLIGLTLMTEANAETYLGEYCWQEAEDGSDTTALKLGVYAKEGGHYELLGTRNNSIPVHGNAEVFGDDVVLTYVASLGGAAGDAWGNIITATLDLSTLSGSFHYTGVSAENTPPKAVYGYGSITKTTCP